MDEKLLARQASAGDKEAFAALYMRYRDDLYRYAYFRLGNEEDVRDAVSACIVEAKRCGVQVVDLPYPLSLLLSLYRSAK